MLNKYLLNEKKREGRKEGRRKSERKKDKKTDGKSVEPMKSTPNFHGDSF